MRAVLVDNVLLDAETGKLPLPQPHLGLIALAASMRQAGHDAVVYDPKADLTEGASRLGPGFYRDAAARIAELDVDLAGFTSLGCNFVCTASIATELRRLRPDLPIVLGGPHASILDREVLQAVPAFDLVVRGEADLTVAPMLEALGGTRSFSSVEGLSYREAGSIARTADAAAILDLDALPFPAYDIYPTREMCPDTIGVDAGRGCPFSCTFCSTASFFGRRFRLRSAGALVAMLDRIALEYGIRDFTLHHDLFTVNKVKVYEFCAAVRDRGYTWGCSARLDCVDDDLLAAMAEAGCNRIYYGIETGSPRLQRAVSKHLDLELLHPRVSTSIAHGMTVTASFIIGYPQETPVDQDETTAMIDELVDRYDGTCAPQLHVLAPEPGTGLIAEFGDHLRFDGYLTDSVMPLQAPEDRGMIAGDPVIFPCYYYYDAATDRSETIAVREGFRELMPYPVAIVRALRARYPSMRELLLAFGRNVIASGTRGGAALAGFVENELGLAAFADAIRCIDVVARLPAPGVRSATRSLRLAPWSTTLPTSFDPVAVLQRVRAGESETLASDPPARSRWLVVRGRSAGAYSAIAIDERTAEMCELLKDGASQALLEHRFGADRAASRLRVLAAFGVLEGYGLGARRRGRAEHVGDQVVQL
jgi:radical SAM superfamily enzyme YgiQ (UPF0313 family)